MTAARLKLYAICWESLIAKKSVQKFAINRESVLKAEEVWESVSKANIRNCSVSWEKYEKVC